MELLKNVALRDHTTFHIGGPADYFVRARSRSDIRDACIFAASKSLPLTILGEGSNVLVSDNGLRGVVVKIETMGVTVRGDVVDVEAGEHWDTFVATMLREGRYGLENLSGIPGTVGAAPIQNIGAYGREVSSYIDSVTVLDRDNLSTVVLTSTSCGFGYRDSVFKSYEGKCFVVLSIAFRLLSIPSIDISYADLQKTFAGTTSVVSPDMVRHAVLTIRHKKFPDLATFGTAGSFFKNPLISQEAFDALTSRHPAVKGRAGPHGMVKVYLASIIDAVCTLKDFRIGNAIVSSAQPLVIITEAHASSNDVRKLAEHVEESVFVHTGIRIEREVTYME